MTPEQTTGVRDALDRFRAEVPDGVHVTLVVVEVDTEPEGSGLHKHCASAWTADVYPRDLGERGVTPNRRSDGGRVVRRFAIGVAPFAIGGALVAAWHLSQPIPETARMALLNEAALSIPARLVVDHPAVALGGITYSEPAYAFVAVHVGDVDDHSPVRLDVYRFDCLCVSRPYWSHTFPERDGWMILPIPADMPPGLDFIEIQITDAEAHRFGGGDLQLAKIRISDLPRVSYCDVPGVECSPKRRAARP